MTPKLLSPDIKAKDTQAAEVIVVELNLLDLK